MLSATPPQSIQYAEVGQREDNHNKQSRLESGKMGGTQSHGYVAIPEFFQTSILKVFHSLGTENF